MDDQLLGAGPQSDMDTSTALGAASTRIFVPASATCWSLPVIAASIPTDVAVTRTRVVATRCSRREVAMAASGYVPLRAGGYGAARRSRCLRRPKPLTTYRIVRGTGTRTTACLRTYSSTVQVTQWPAGK